MTQQFDNRKIEAEGWFIAECGDYLDSAGRPRPWQLQRDDEAARFDSDQAAWAHVLARARAGSPLHQSALGFLEIHSPAEYFEIMIYSVTGNGGRT